MLLACCHQALAPWALAATLRELTTERLVGASRTANAGGLLLCGTGTTTPNRRNAYFANSSRSHLLLRACRCTDHHRWRRADKNAPDLVDGNPNGFLDADRQQVVCPKCRPPRTQENTLSQGVGEFAAHPEATRSTGGLLTPQAVDHTAPTSAIELFQVESQERPYGARGRTCATVRGALTATGYASFGRFRRPSRVAAVCVPSRRRQGRPTGVLRTRRSRALDVSVQALRRQLCGIGSVAG